MGFEAVVELINNAAYQARHICGSEGLYQCIVYDLALRSSHINSVQREVPVVLHSGKTGYLDFVIESGEVCVAIELKAGANSHRNSLDKAMEIDRKFGAEKSGGLLKDFEKLDAFLKANGKKSSRAISVCMETAFIKYGFSSKDVDRYSALANKRSIDFVYGTPGNEPVNLWVTGSKRRKVALKCNLKEPIGFLGEFELRKLDWEAYFSHIAISEPKDETFAQGMLYHYLRNMGLTEKQCASEVFFYCARKPGTRASYWLPDIAVFSPNFNGRFNLGVDNQEKLLNDYEKLCNLNAIIEIKGSLQFEKLSTCKKLELLRQDLEKLNLHLRSQIDAQLRLEGIRREKPVTYAMVIASNDKELTNFVREAEAEYGKAIQIFWSGSYI